MQASVLERILPAVIKAETSCSEEMLFSTTLRFLPGVRPSAGHPIQQIDSKKGYRGGLCPSHMAFVVHAASSIVSKALSTANCRLCL